MGRRFGKTKADGSVEIEPNECVLTGRFVSPDNSVSVRVENSPYFFRIVGGQADRMTDDLRAQWEGEARLEFEPAPMSLPVIEVAEDISARRNRSKIVEGEV